MNSSLIKPFNYITESLSGDIPLELTKVEGGTFMMGGNVHEREHPVHEVKVSDFWMGKYLVYRNLDTNNRKEKSQHLTLHKTSMPSKSWSRR